MSYSISIKFSFGRLLRLITAFGIVAAGAPANAVTLTVIDSLTSVSATTCAINGEAHHQLSVLHCEKVSDTKPNNAFVGGSSIGAGISVSYSVQSRISILSPTITGGYHVAGILSSTSSAATNYDSDLIRLHWDIQAGLFSSVDGLALATVNLQTNTPYGQFELILIENGQAPVRSLIGADALGRLTFRESAESLIATTLVPPSQEISDSLNISFDAHLEPVPEASSVAYFLTGLAALSFLIRSRRL